MAQIAEPDNLHDEGVEGTRGDIVRQAAEESSATVLRKLGVTVGKGAKFECPECEKTGASFKGPGVEFLKRWTCSECQATGTIVDVVSRKRGLSETDAARWILGEQVEANGSGNDDYPTIDDAGIKNKPASLEPMQAGYFEADKTGRSKGNNSMIAEIKKDALSVSDVSGYLSYILSDGKRREIRYLKNRPNGKTITRHYVTDTAADVLGHVQRMNGAGWNCYITINPLRQDFEGESASDEHIESRTFIPVDVDPKRKSKTLATVEQRDKARAVADQVIDWYKAEFPNHAEPSLCCSGSGWQVLFPCDMPNDDATLSLIKRMMEGLEKSFNTEDVKIDQAVKNASRIMRICGTVAHYGDGGRAGFVESLPLVKKTALTVADLLPIFLEPEPQVKHTLITEAVRPEREATDSSRIDGFIDEVLNDVRTAPDLHKHNALYAKTAKIANYVAGHGQIHREAEIKGLILKALRENPGHVASWEAASDTIDDAWHKGKSEPEKLPDRPLKRAGKPSASESESRPEIVIPLENNNPHVVFEQVMQILPDAGAYYRDGLLCRIVPGDSVSIRGVGMLSISGPAIDNHDVDSLTPALLNVATFKKEVWDEKAKSAVTKQTTPSATLIRQFLRLKRWPTAQHLTGITSGPYLRHDGSVCTEPGYDPVTGWYLDYQGEPICVSDSPTESMARDACNVLLGLIADFEWKSDCQKCGWLAYLLTLIARPGIEGHVPAFVFSASTPGAGKSLLVNCANLIAYGRNASGYKAPQQVHDAGSEWKKMLFSVAISGTPSLVISNYPSGKPIGNAEIDGQITETRVTDRVLGRHEMKEASWTAVMAFTGNNLATTADFSFRSIWSVLEPSTENPRERTGFKIEDIESHILKYRADYLRKALTILRWHAMNPAKAEGAKHFGSFEAWALTVRDAIFRLTSHDVVENKTDAIVFDQEGDEFTTLMSGLKDYCDWRASEGKKESFPLSELYSDLTQFGHSNSWPELREVLDVSLSQKAFNTASGRIFSKCRGRAIGGIREGKKLKLVCNILSKKPFWRILEI